MADALRTVTLLVLLADTIVVPLGIGMMGRPPRTWMLLLGMDVLLVSRAAYVLDRYGNSEVRWWGTPLSLVGALLLFAYGSTAIHQERARRKGKA